MDCLLTKLKGNLKADTPFFDGVRFYYTAENIDAKITMNGEGDIFVKTFDSDFNKLTEVACNKSGQTSVENLFKNGVMGCIFPKSKIENFSLNIAGTAIPNDFCVKLEDLRGADLRDFRVDRNYAQTGDIATLSGMENLSFIWAHQTSMTGKIENLKGLKSLATFGALELSDIEGDLGLFIQNMKDCGRATGTINCPTGFWLRKDYSSKAIYYNGKAINASMSEPAKIYWEANKSYVKKGSQVFCAGYTESEISANKGSGGIWEGATEVVSCD